MAKFFELFKRHTTRVLEQRVVSLGVCSKCHAKALRVKYTTDRQVWMQCGECFAVFIKEDDKSNDQALAAPQSDKSD